MSRESRYDGMARVSGELTGITLADGVHGKLLNGQPKTMAKRLDSGPRLSSYLIQTSSSLHAVLKGSTASLRTTGRRKY